MITGLRFRPSWTTRIPIVLEGRIQSTLENRVSNELTLYCRTMVWAVSLDVDGTATSKSTQDLA